MSRNHSVFRPVAEGGVSTEPSHLADDPRVTQALEEYLAALESGQAPDRKQFEDRYADVADALGDYLDGLEFMHHTAVDIHALSGSASAGLGSTAAGGISLPLEDYHVLREVGRGGMGVVYEAMQISLGRRVALKVLPFASTLNSKQLQRFKNEAQAAAQLHHTSTVPVYATGCERGVHYYAMQFIEGHTLAAIIADLRTQAGRGQKPLQGISTASLATPAIGIESALVAGTDSGHTGNLP
jgi:eukaryotic-like serine/threonine-protein kinase